eukprot:scaffold408608_cov17-Prasinocladus_malaysianus.AAC.1
MRLTSDSLLSKLYIKLPAPSVSCMSSPAVRTCKKLYICQPTAALMTPAGPLPHPLPVAGQ